MDHGVMGGGGHGGAVLDWSRQGFQNVGQTTVHGAHGTLGGGNNPRNQSQDGPDC